MKRDFISKMSYIFIFLHLLMTDCMWMYELAMTHIWRSEDSLWELGLSFQMMWAVGIKFRSSTFNG